MEDYGCDMRGMLSFQILWLLSRKSMNGTELAEEIKKRRGEKPKAGTLYPALKHLSSKELIIGKKNGRAISYSLTQKGKRAVKYSTLYFCRSFGDIFESQ